MRNFKYYCHNVVITISLGLLSHGCQHRLQVTGEGESVTTSRASMPSRLKRPYDALTHENENKIPVITQKESQEIKQEDTVTASEDTKETTNIRSLNAVPISVGVGQEVRGEPGGEGGSSKDITVQGPYTKKEEILQASSGLMAWFQRFVDVLGHADEWAEVAGVLAEGRRCGYLDKSVAWDDDQYTPLHYAAEEGNLEVIKELVGRDKVPVDIITSERKRTPLQFAASAGHLQAVKFLVGQGAAVSYMDEQGANVLHYAAAGCDEPSIAIIDFLVNSLKDTPIIDSKVNKELSVFTFALHAANIHLVRHLISNYPQIVPAKDSEEGRRLLRYAHGLTDTQLRDELEQAMGAKKS